jgi:hypothetical protein
MSGYGTKKRGADVAQQLTFPAVFSEAVAQRENPYGYYPQQQRNPVILPVGDDLQDKYHEQKRLDANRRVMNAVMDNRASTARFLKSHQNYDLPRPVLGQRIFANPSLGNQSDIYSHRPIDWNQSSVSSLQGGVLFTQEAQKWGRQKLADRIPQLNAIELAKQAFLTGVPVGTVERGAPSEAFPIGSTVELMATLQSLASAIQMGSITGLTLGEMVKFLRLLFRWATGATQDELQEVLQVVDSNLVGLQGIEDEFAEGVAEGVDGKQIRAYNDQLTVSMRKVRDYLKRMIGVVNLSAKERQKASANFIKNVGFTAISRLSAEAVDRELKAELANARSFREATERGERKKEEREFRGIGNVFGVELNEDERERRADEAGPFFGDSSSSSSSTSVRNPMRSQQSAQLPEELPEAPDAEFEGPARASSSASSGTMSLEAIRNAVNNRKTNAKTLHDKLVGQRLIGYLPTKSGKNKKTTSEEYRQHIRNSLNL